MAPDHRTDPRMAGHVVRYHTWPMQERWTVAAHSWNVARLALMLDEQLSRDALVEALMHDIGEIGPGDPPYPVKRDNQLFAEHHRRIERDTRLAMCIPWGLPAPRLLSTHDEWVLKLADMLESWETGLEEVMRGNRLGGELVCQRADEWLTAQIAQVRAMPDGSIARAVRERVVNNLASYMARRRSLWTRS